MTILRRMLVTMALLVGALVLFAANALAALHPGNPNGLPKNNSVAAFAQVMQRASSDVALSSLMAHETGESRFVASHYTNGGYQKAGPGTNTGWTSTGSIVPANSTSHCHTGAQVLMVINVQTFRGLEFCTGCANPHLRQIILNLPKQSWAKTAVMRFNKHVQTVKTKTCPNGTPVKVTINTWVKGVVTARAAGQLQGKMTGYISAQVNVIVTQQVTIQCGSAPQPPATQPGDCNAINSPGAVVCSTIVNICGQQVVYTGPANQLQDWITNYQNQNCPSTPSTPGSPPPPPPPPPPTPQAPSCNNVSTPENGSNGIYANGETYPGTANVYAPNGDSLAVSFSNSGPGSGSITSSSSFNSNGTDTASFTYKAPNDSSAAGQSDRITITVHDNTTGLTGSCSSGSFVISAAPPPRPDTMYHDTWGSDAWRQANT